MWPGKHWDTGASGNVIFHKLWCMFSWCRPGKDRTAMLKRFQDFGSHTCVYIYIYYVHTKRRISTLYNIISKSSMHIPILFSIIFLINIFVLLVNNYRHVLLVDILTPWFTPRTWFWSNVERLLSDLDGKLQASLVPFLGPWIRSQEQDGAAWKRR